MDVAAEPLDQLRMRTSAKWTLYPPDVLPLFVAEMDYPIAAPVAAAIIGRVCASDTGYVAGAGPLGPAFAGYARARWNWEVDPSRIHTTTDVSVAIVEVLRRVVHPGEGVVITPPVYPPFFELVQEAGASVVEVPLVDDGEAWSLDLRGLERAFASGARAFLLCHPHNPLGLVHSAATLGRVAELAQRYDVTVVSDEIHGPLTHPGVAFTPFLAVSDAARTHGICVTSASKAWNLAGVKCAVMVAGSARTAAVLDGLPHEVGARTSILGLHASVAGFSEPESQEWLDGAIASIVSNSALLTELLREHLPGVSYRPGQASYLAWLDFRGLGWGDDPSARALADARVALLAGPDFGREGKGFARLNLACSPEVLTDALTRLAAIAR